MIVSVSPLALHEHHTTEQSVDLLDVRNESEYVEGHVQYAWNLPLDRLNAAAVLAARRDPQQPLYVICRTGRRSLQACEQLQAAGLENVINVEGGTVAAEASGLPIARGV